MAINEQIVTGKKYRQLVDKANRIWKRISFWTKSSDVEFNDGKTAETKVGAIDGITNSLASNSSRIALSAAGGYALNNKIVNGLGGCSIYQSGSDFYVRGADSVTKKLGSADFSLNFKVSGIIYNNGEVWSGFTHNATITCADGQLSYSTEAVSGGTAPITTKTILGDVSITFT